MLFFSLSARPARLVLLILLALGLALPTHATHIRAGDIQAVADPRNLLRYTFTLRLYTDETSLINEDNANICFGDGTSALVPRLSKTPLNSCIEVSENIFTFAHVFPAPGRYSISYLGNNRNAAILNLGTQPADLSIYISTTILIDATTGINSSPVFLKKPIDVGAIRQVFTHAPGASDADGDSLSFEFVTPRQGRIGGLVCDPSVPITAFVSPRDPQFTGGPQVFNIDPRTGLITWNSPKTEGEFNVAYIAHEWRSLGGGVFREVGSVVRDMQITITNSFNRPPDLTLPPDTCIVANTTLTGLISATDPDGQPVTISAVGGPLAATPGAQLSAVSPNPRTIRFTWTPDCRLVTRQPYLTTFTAEDVVPNCQTSLAKLAVWRVRVVGPKPQRLTAAVEGPTQIRLSWAAYECRGVADSLRVYRKINATSFDPDVCDTGIPKRLGYQYIGSVAAADTTFIDDNDGKRFKRGTTYCYRIYATWPLPGRGESLASDEACATTDGLLPVLTNATVDATDTVTGQVTVKWTKGDPGVLPAVYTSYYRLARTDDATPTAYTLVRDRIPLTDTVHVDAPLNTRERQYRYRLELVSEDINLQLPTFVDTAQQATTPFLAGVIMPNRQIDLSWAYDVPWDNTPRQHYIYRLINSTFTLIDSVLATATGGAYTDPFTFGGIPFGGAGTYTYKVLTRGQYTVATRQPANTENYSQEVIIKRLPCPPVLRIVAPDCAAEAQNCPPELFNQLYWHPELASPCATDIASYKLYFRPTADGAFTLLATTADTAYRHTPLTTRVGCYAVTAVDSSDNESPQSNIVCQDNCQYFTLPNIITPQNDGINDQFTPICASPLKKVKFTVFNRWGRLVYEGDKDPRINWAGTSTSGTKLADGAYFYRAEVEFDSLQPTTKAYKGWVQIGASHETGGTPGGQ